MLVGMDIGGVEAMAADLRGHSDDLRSRHRTVVSVLDGAARPTAMVLGLDRIASELWAEAADLHRRAVMFEEAEQLALSRLSLSLLLRSWAGGRIDPTEPEPPPLTIAELEDEIARLGNTTDPQQLRQLRMMLALVTANEAASERRDLERGLDRLYPGIPNWEWYNAARTALEEQILGLLLVELQQEKLLFDLETSFSCPPDWEHADRYREIQIQTAYLQWELASLQAGPLGRIEQIIEGIGEAERHEQMSFVEAVAGDLEAHPDGLPIALMLLADMDESQQAAVLAGIAENGHLEGLLAAVDDFEESLEPKKSSWGPVGDFVGGVWDGVSGAVTGVWGVTLQGTYDWDGWKENWSGVGQSFQMLFESPGDFLYQVADIDTLKGNPERWLGGLVPDVAAAVFTGGTVTAASRAGRLGTTMSRIATKLDNLTLRMGARLDNIITDPTLRRLIERTRFRLPVGITAAQLDEMGVLVRQATEHIDGEALIHGSRGSGVARLDSDIDIAILVDDAEFDRLMDEAFGTPNPGSARERTMDHADLVGKIRTGDARLRDVRAQLMELLGYDVDISIIRRGGAFDQGPYLSIGGGES